MSEGICVENGDDEVDNARGRNSKHGGKELLLVNNKRDGKKREPLKGFVLLMC